MRKVFPRILNFISFLIAIISFIPDTFILTILGSMSFLANFTIIVTEFFKTSVWYSIRVLYIPIYFVAISLIYLIIATIDRNIKKHDKKTTPSLDLMGYQPILIFGIVSSILGIIASSFDFIIQSPFVLLDTDYFMLGGLLKTLTSNPFTFPSYVSLIFFGVLFIAQLLIYLLAFKKNYEKPFILRFLSFLLVLILAFLSIKGYNAFNMLDASTDFLALFTFVFPNNVVNLSQGIIADATLLNIEFIVFISITIFLIVGYIIVAISKAIKYNKVIKNNEKEVLEKEEDEEIFKPINGVPTFEDLTKDIKEVDSNIESLDTQTTIPDSIYEKPEVEEIVQTVIEEKTVIKQVIFEKSNLDSIYAYNFNFSNVQMVINNDGSQDYYVNKVKFLTLSNNNKFMSFRLELDRAIKLIIQYPLICKDKYEDHKIWFKVENADQISNDIVIMIIKDAYNAIINEE